MTDAIKPARMLAFSEVGWSEIIPAAESPFEFLTLKDIPVYYKVDREKGVVYREYQAVLGYTDSEVANWPIGVVTIPDMSANEEVSIASMPFAGFNEDIAFVRIDEDEMVELASYGFCHASAFKSEGIQMPALYEVKGRTVREITRLGKKNSSLARVWFDKALIVDRKRYAAAERSPWDKPDPNQFAMVVEVRSDNLYLLSTDIEALKLEREKSRLLVAYPFANAERMPGIYWMFQAAYAQNGMKSLPKDDVASWLKEKAPTNTYRYKSIRTASKFVWPELDRSRGRKGRGNFVLEDLDEWTISDSYVFEFVSKGLSFVLAIADWWVKVINKNPKESRLELAKKLDENKFRGLEVDDLVYLIGGEILSEEEAKLFKKYLKEKEKGEQLKATKSIAM